MGHVKKDSVMVLGVLAALIISAMVFVYVPQSRKLNSLRTHIAAQKLALEQDAEKVRLVPQLLRQIKAMKQRYDERWEKKLPKRRELGAFLREISQNLEREDLAGRLIEPGNPRKEDLFYTLPILMRFQGSFAAFSNFLDRLDRMERLTRIQKVQIIADSKQAPAVLDVQLRMNIYFTDTESLAG